LNSTRSIWKQYGPLLAFAAALTSMLGSLYYSEIVGFVPCTLCWYQRILMYPLTLVTVVGIIRQDRALPAYVLPLSVLGMGMSSYHYLLQLGVIGHSGACKVGIPCDLRYVNYFGFLTIPLMALTGFVIITTAMALTARAGRTVGAARE
jgi:disulfide bond formation protein DsbB